MPVWNSEPRGSFSGSEGQVDTSRSFRRLPVQTSEAGLAFGLREERPFELPARLFEQLPFAVYICDPDGLVIRYNRRAAELRGRSPKLGDPDERFCGSYRMFRPDGSPLAHHQCPMADVLRTGVSVRQQEVHIERPNGSRGIALVDIEPIRDSDGNIVGAVNCFQDITERKRTEAQITVLAREAEHRAKNVLASVQAAVHLSHSDTPEGLKHAIEGRIQALANVHRLFVESRWAGAELHSLVKEELAAYCRDGERRARIDGPKLLMRPDVAQAVAVALHEFATNAAKYGALSVAEGHVRVEWSRASDGRLVLRWTETCGPPVKPPTRQGFGTRVMDSMIRGQLKGEMHFDWRAEGLACEIVLPV
jgi:PAS domain S-box-containing protein